MFHLLVALGVLMTVLATAGVYLIAAMTGPAPKPVRPDQNAPAEDRADACMAAGGEEHACVLREMQRDMGMIK